MKFDRTAADCRIVTERLNEAFARLKEQVALWQPRPMPKDWRP